MWVKWPIIMWSCFGAGRIASVFALHAPRSESVAMIHEHGHFLPHDMSLEFLEAGTVTNKWIVYPEEFQLARL